MPGPRPDIDELPALPGQVSGDVLALAVRAARHDGVRPLSEQTVLQARRLPEQADSHESGTHLVLRTDGGVAGYGHVDLSDPDAPSAEIVVDPEHRRRGLGGTLLDHVLRRWPQVRLWSHGDLQDARTLYGSRGLRVVRELWQMSRPLAGEWSDLPAEVELPDGFEVRTYRVGADDEPWLALNARAFADHPEQGRMTLADLHDRQEEPWFDPSGFLVVVDTTDVDPEGEPRLAAFHWTKVETDHPDTGEVYVVGVDPDYQGRGLGSAVTLLGLQHLRNRGVETATLYVDGDNDPAIATYHRLGFERSAIDVMYAAGDADA
ncbi:Acetyl-CoA:Cys-GlcN-Ins acetyltransferase, mycothiol synthase MshD [Serinicoccus hydrothermalis]|uniref:Mycothiol acetyltransferase n=1 Tax=Serinicoccus hydrothermalis TaxID=1758689 RepID=A0A1B1NF02_9MICO|nr:mycothiol synthase [Serinicoccus hydrothermalis]ANS79989.1 Acetyl-CoA:Cys-GlcN-Ins acetyltransferase, mycothiol synthase MshD [Serinicoccus hydrothermalis]